MARKTARNGSSGKRELILRAATGVFARNGYFNSKVADIARAADVADGTVYLYFKSKEEILHSIFDQNMAEAIAAGRELIKELADPREKLRRIARLHLERLVQTRFLVDVDFDRHHVAVRLVDDLLDDRPEGLARTAPRGPEIDDDGHLHGLVQDLGLERCVGDIGVSHEPNAIRG